MTGQIKPVLFFGGTFNPPHNGHLNLVRYVAGQMDFGLIYVVPAYHPPHKSDDATSFEDRLEMTRILFSAKDVPANVEISDLERHLETPSYSWRTLECLRERHPLAKIYMLIGMDMYLNLHKWANHETLVKNYNFIILKRENLSVAKLSPGDILMDNPHWNISSNEIRRLIVEYAKTLDKGILQKLETLIPPELLAYIDKRGIYRLPSMEKTE